MYAGLDYYSRFALQSEDKELLLLINIVIIGEIQKILEVKMKVLNQQIIHLL